MKAKITKSIIAELRSRALVAARQAYAPYSKIQVGAAILANNGNIYSGCNVENASYGLTICAERSAISWAIQEVQKDRHALISAIYIINEKLPIIPPCGACRQVIFEFGEGGMVYFEGTKGVKKIAVAGLLPAAFKL